MNQPHSHELLDRLIADYRRVLARDASKLDRTIARRAAFAALDGHLRQRHGYRHHGGLPPTIEDLIVRHQREHAFIDPDHTYFSEGTIR